MERYIFCMLLLAVQFCGFSQDFDGPRPTLSSSNGVNLGFNYNTNIQFTTHTHSASHGILFNSYKSSPTISGSLTKVGNTKHANPVGAYGGGAGAIMFFGNGGTMGFYISGSSPGADSNVDWGNSKMLLRRNGEVGIGTGNTSGYRLSVGGTIRSEEIKVDADWADYVFDETYELLPLSELEAFIKANKHLPGVPTAEEVEAEGIALGEMNAKLLEKIEELTLHQIKMSKELKAQGRELRAEREYSRELERRLERLEE